MFSAFMVFINTSFDRHEVYYDCMMAEWHPDVPIAVKEECRRIRYEEWKRRHQNEPQQVAYYDTF